MSAKNVSYTYKIDLKFHIPKEDPIEPYMINRVVKVFNYFNDFCSFYICEALMDLRYLEKIRGNQNRIYCNMIITLEKKEIIDLEENPENENKNIEPFSTEEVLNHSFIPFFTDSSFSDVALEKDYNPDLSSINTEETIKADDGTEIDVLQSNNPVSNSPHKIIFTLYSIKGLNINKNILNLVTGQCDVGTVVKYMISYSEVEEAIIDKPDNESEYENIIIPPHNLNMAIKDLQARYGIYNSGLIVYYEAPTLYVLKRVSTDHDRSSKQYKNMKMNIYVNPSLSLMNIGAAIEDGTNSLEYNMNTIVERSNVDIYNSELLGNEFMYSNFALTANVAGFKEGVNTGTMQPIVSIVMPNVKHESTNNKIIVEYDELNNSYNMASIAKMMSFHTTIRIKEMFGIREDSFRPNSIFLINIKDDDTKNDEINGYYSILKGSIEYRRISTGENTFTCKVQDLYLNGVNDK